VRAPLVVPVQLTHGKAHLSGMTLDLSEGGLRCVLDSLVEQPSASAGDAAETLSVGERMAIVVTLDSAVVEGRAEVVRRQHREDGQTELSLRFVGLPEVTKDVIRRAVFACLRDLRLRGLI
jgi:c-di-GMP-binding flagellar brake protein YcgR